MRNENLRIFQGVLVGDGNGEADHTSAPRFQATYSSTAVTAMLLGIAFWWGVVSP